MGPVVLADRIRRVGQQYIFGEELNCAQATHWQMQWRSPEAISEFQWGRISELVHHAREKSPFYRARLGEALPALLTPELFARIAPLRRAELIAQSRLIRAHDVAGSSIGRRSGGSRGSSVQVQIDATTYCWYLATLWRGLKWWDTDIAERGAVLLGPGTRGIARIPGRVKDWMMNWLRLIINEEFDATLPAILGRVESFTPSFIYGYPSAVDRLAELAMRRGWQPRRALKIIVVTGEPLYEFQRRRIAETFQCPVVQEYGSGELGCMAFECREGTLHITAENVFLETADRESPLISPEGNILVTHLRNFLFPLIRYETGDVGVIGGRRCRCGRGLPSLELIGRREEYLTGNGEPRPAYPVLDQLFMKLPATLRGRVRLVHRRSSSIVVQAERHRVTPSDLEQIKDLIHSIVGSHWHVGVVGVDRLSRLPSGKMSYFARSTEPS